MIKERFRKMKNKRNGKIKANKAAALMGALLLAASISGCTVENGVNPEEEYLEGYIEENGSANAEEETGQGPEDYLSAALSKFSVRDLEGNEVTEEIYKNSELTMINLWGTFCGPCINEMPELGELSRELSEEGRVQIIGIPLDVVVLNENNEIVSDEEMVGKALEIVEETGADYTHLIPEGDFGMYLIGSGAAQYVPTTFFVDSEGKLVGEGVVGAKDKASWEKEIEERLGSL